MSECDVFNTKPELLFRNVQNNFDCVARLQPWLANTEIDGESTAPELKKRFKKWNRKDILKILEVAIENFVVYKVLLVNKNKN